MTLLQPWWLLLLLLAPVIIALHNRRRRRIAVPALLIWKQLAQTDASQSLSQRPVLNLPLMLQLLVLLTVSLALTRPQAGTGSSPDHWVILHDTSAAMLEHAAEPIPAEFLQLNPGSRLTVMEVSGDTSVLATRLTDRRLLPRESPAFRNEDIDWLTAFNLLESVITAGESTLVTVISTPTSAADAAWLLANRYPEAATDFRISGPSGSNNRFHTVSVERSDDHWLVRGSVAADTDVEFRFQPEGASTSLEWGAVSSGDRRFSTELELPGNGLLELVLPEDILSADNTYQVPIRTEQDGTHVLLAGPENLPLQRALLAVDGLRLSQAATLPAGPAGTFDLVVLDQLQPAPDADTATLTFIPGEVSGPTRIVPPYAGPELQGLEVYEHTVLTPGTNDEIIISSTAGPLGLLRHTDSGPQLTLGFSLPDSNWAELASFPAFIDWVVQLATAQPAPQNLSGALRPLAAFTEQTHLAEARMVSPPVELWRWLLLVAAAALLTDAALGWSGKVRGSGRNSPSATAGQLVAAILFGVALVGLALPRPVFAPATALVAEEGTGPMRLPRINLGQTVPAGALADALNLAAGLIPGGREIVVALSGPETEGQLLPLLKRLRSRGFTVSVVPAREVTSGELQVSGVIPPARAREGETHILSALVHAAGSGEARMSLYRNGAPAESRTVQLTDGLNLVDFEVSPEAGSWLYEVDVAGHGDTEVANNRNGVLLEVASRPGVAVISRSANLGNRFARALQLQGMQTDVLTPVSLPWSTAGYEAYDSVILMDVPALELHSAQQAVLEEWVRQHGGGLVMLGGENSFGPGGYYQTPLDDLSPLSSLVERESPEVALLFVLDSSGSMQQAVGETNRLEIARQATLGAIRALGTGSQAGIVVFDTRAEVLVPLQSTESPAAFEEGLKALVPNGGTSILPALEHALEQMQDVDASAKHVILMSDGLSQPADFAPVLRELRALNVTVSTVAVGDGADSHGLADIARLGAGATHAIADFQALPSILGQEALLLAGNSIEDETFVPVWHDAVARPRFAALAEVPELHGFVRTTLKESATLHLSAADGTDDTTPLLATWRYGLGSVAAFASHGSGNWSSAWEAQPDYPALWSQVVRWSMQSVVPVGITIQTRLSGAELHVLAQAVRPDGSPWDWLELEAVIVDPAGNLTDLAVLEPAEPGIYRATMQAREPGLNWVGVSPRAGSSLPGPSGNHGFMVGWPAALDHAATDWRLPERIASATDGRILGSLSGLRGGSIMQWHALPFPEIWLCMALMSYFVSLYVRYAQRAATRQTGRQRATGA